MESGKILRMAQVTERTGLGRTAIYKRLKKGTFPQPVSLGFTAVGWHEADIDAWIAKLRPVSEVKSGGETRPAA